MEKGGISRVEILKRYLDELQKLNDETFALYQKYKNGFKRVSEALDCLEALYEIDKREIEIDAHYRGLLGFFSKRGG
jgi:hypothetical protein